MTLIHQAVTFRPYSPLRLFEIRPSQTSALKFTPMPTISLLRRRLLAGAAGLPLLGPTLAWPQPAKAATTSRTLTIAQIIDVSPTQQDVSRDFMVGSRAAWQEINARGGIKGRQIEHAVLEVDGTVTSLQGALVSIRNQPNCVALSGTAGDRAASRLAAVLRQEQLEIAHVAPWLHKADLDESDSTFPIFASRQEQIAHALKSLSVIGVSQLGAVYASSQEYELYRADVERAASELKLRLSNYAPTGNLRETATRLTPDTPVILLFLGGTPELAQFTQALDRQARQRYVIGLADVNLQTMMQLGAARNTPVMATQVVPMVNASLPIVRAYRETLGRLFAEAPTPLSLAGYIAARYTHDVLQTIDGAPTRQSVLQTFQRRSSLDLGGFHISVSGKRRGSGYVTQSMLSADGRIVG